MCVIAVCETKRITPEQVAKMWDANDSGAGVAWREGEGKEKRVHWRKGLSLDEAQDLIAELPIPFVAHFRIPSCGGPSKQLTHPFPIEKTTNLALSGNTKGMVLFHNGHWNMWKSTTMDACLKSGVPLPAGRWSDSRSMAWMASVYGIGVLEFIDEKVIAFGPDTIEAIGTGWSKVGDIWVSNKGWEHRHVSNVRKPVSMIHLPRERAVSGGGPIIDKEIIADDEDKEGKNTEPTTGSRGNTGFSHKGSGGSSSVVPFEEMEIGEDRMAMALTLQKQKLLSNKQLKKERSKYEEWRRTKKQKRSRTRELTLH